ncbi:uroporphyrinogen decarboxylase [Picrophilus oshimae]|uniref:Uroporphyrinogen decarboxylase n=1 Tax=Picrophilus torridus (strain ATCC 700027 / DSM 9790 / JCM 10055 / NBRC 100828 / KAW 2/3) TaxID=1122961 RepID=A0A8G2FWU8_PICTO|nr:uroporphyrinogen decarboxylase [Picrophilus oshimae]SMD30931.1 uroporphyrinogen decarboxylase [Picrophilus oshimae DSM 9789]
MNSFISMIRNGYSDTIPVWFMRQAGRYLKEYNEKKGRMTIKEICMDPELIAGISYDPVRILNVDAAIIFSDITIPLEALGYKIEFLPGGPRIINGYIKNHDMKDIIYFEESNFKYKIYDAIKIFKEKYHFPLIGFSGGLITVLSYIIAGGPDSNLNLTKRSMLSDDKFNDYINIIKDMIIKYIRLQVRAGVDAIQIFDSWLGYLSPQTYENYIKGHIEEILSEINVPVIYFSTGTSSIIEKLSRLNIDYISVDWRLDMKLARSMVNKKGLQGNLDPLIAAYNLRYALKETSDIINAAGRSSYIFNLGHGVIPETPVENLKHIVNFVHHFNQ